MPKRKSGSPSHAGGISAKSHVTLSSLDAALDLLATETFTRLDSLIAKFETAAGVTVAPGQAKARWEEAVKRYWVMRSMEVLSCSAPPSAGTSMGEDNGAEIGHCGQGRAGSSSEMQTDIASGSADRKGDCRAVTKPHVGPVPLYGLCPDEEQQWRRWTPRTGDVVLVDLPDDGVWPGKIIDKKLFYQGRSMPKGYHYFPVRIYCESITPCVMVKSRLLPLHLRPSPPLLAPARLQSAYNHALSPESFDTAAHAREQTAAHARTHPGYGPGRDPAEVKAEKERWNEQVNWVMNERRAEKMRALAEEREKRLATITVDPHALTNDYADGEGYCSEGKQGRNGDAVNGHWADVGTNGASACPKSDGDIACNGAGKKKRRTSIPLPELKKGRSESPLPTNTIFGPNIGSSSLLCTPRRTSSPALVAGIIRPGLGLAGVTPPISPRRTEKRRSVYSGVGEYSPNRGRGSTWTPPRILPSGDETAPIPRRLVGIGRGNDGAGAMTTMPDGEDVQLRSSPIPSVTFDFVSPLGPVVSGRLAHLNGIGNGNNGLSNGGDIGGEPNGMDDLEPEANSQGRRIHRAGSLNGLEAVKEDPAGEEDGWTVVVNGKKGRSARASELKPRSGSAPCESAKGVPGSGAIAVMAVEAGQETQGGNDDMEM